MRDALMTALVLAAMVSGRAWAADQAGPAKPAAPVNLVRNPGFEAPDPKDPQKAEHWNFGKNTAEWACRTDEDAHSGKYCLKLSATEEKAHYATEVGQMVKLEPGKKYLIRCWAKYKERESGALAITAWYYFAAPNKHYGNCKSQINLNPKRKGWQQLSTTYINVYDAKTKKNGPLKQLLPGTVAARIGAAAYYGKMTVYFDDIEFIELPDTAEKK